MNTLQPRLTGSACSTSGRSSTCRAPQGRPSTAPSQRGRCCEAVATEARARSPLRQEASRLSAREVDSNILPLQTLDFDDLPLASPSPFAAAAAPASAAPQAAVGVPVHDLTPDTFQTFLQEAGNDNALVVVDYHTAWCGPCKVMDAELTKLTTIFKSVRFAKFDVGKHEGAFATRQGIRRLPTFRVYKNGRVVDEITGARPVELRQILVHHNRPASFALRSQDMV